MALNEANRTDTALVSISDRWKQSAVHIPEEHPEYDAERNKVLSFLEQSDHVLWKQAYTLPHSVEELREKRHGFYQVADNDSVFAYGLTDYALTLLTSWNGLGQSPLADRWTLPESFSALFQSIRDNRKLATASLNRVKPAEGQKADAPVIRHLPEGILLEGKQTFTAEALFADELLVFLHEENEDAFSTAILIPTNSPNLNLRLYQELVDGVTVEYNQVFVPRERFIVYQNADFLEYLLTHPHASSLVDYQWVSRQFELLEYFAGTAFILADETGLHKELHIQGKLGEVIQGLETLSALLYVAEIGAETSDHGVFLPKALSLHTAQKLAGSFLLRASDVIHRIGGRAVFDSPGNPLTDERAASHPSVIDLIWRRIVSRAAIRRGLHEFYAFGDPAELASKFYQTYPVDHLQERYRQFWEQAERSLSSQ